MAAIAQMPRDEWLTALHGPPAVREPALAELHALLLRAARFELGRRRTMLSDVSYDELEDLAAQAADDAMVALLRKLTRSAGRAASRPGPTSSRCSRRA
jgi:RNA polymerase sigma-70 factor (ECF subfamily)